MASGIYKHLGIKRCITRHCFALFAGICGGVAGVVLDIDHVIAYYWMQVPAGESLRVFHSWTLVIALCVLVFSAACIGRLFVRMVLKKKQMDKLKQWNTIQSFYSCYDTDLPER